MKNKLTGEITEKLEVTYLPNAVVINKKWTRREACKDEWEKQSHINSGCKAS